MGASKSLATSGCCSWHGGESYCDYSTNRWVCGDGTYSPSCTCGGGYYAAPVIPTIPTCPFMSYYDSLSSSCKCMSGYIASGNSCISQQQYCWNTLGYSSTYNYGTGRCECSSGYVYNNGACQSGLTYCMNNYGSFSQYDYLSKNCKCMSGYQFNSSGTRCISKDEACQNQLGIMSKYDSLYDTCDCLSGYEIVSGMCVSKPIPVRNIIIPRIPTSTPTPSYKNTPTPELHTKILLAPTINIKSSNSGGIASPASATYKSFNETQSVLSKIISFITHLFKR